MTEVAERAGRREWCGLVVLVLPTLLVAIDINALFLALPALTAALGTSSAEQLWIIDAYGFMVAGFLITMGTLGDRIGRRRLLLVGGAAFGLASLAAAFATTPGLLIAARIALGVAGATLMPSTLALITSMFADRAQRGTAIAVWATCQFAGAALGPVLGGLLLERFWWGSVFLLAVPVMVLLLLLGPVLLPEHRDPGAGRLDLPAVALSLLAVLPIVYGLKELAVGTGFAPTVVAALAVGLVCGALFARRQLRSTDPLLDLRLLAERSFGAVLATLTFAGVVMAGAGMLVTQYLQTVLGYSPTLSAWWFAPMGLAVAAGTLLTPTITKWISPRTAISGGLVLSAAGSALLALTDGVGTVVTAVAVLALGTGPLFALGTGIVVGSVPPERAGSAASMSETANHLGGTLGIAVLGTIAGAIYRHHMADLPGPARETVAGATAAAAALPPGEAADLVAAAHGAFTSGLHTVGVIGALVFASLALLLVTRLPRQ
ncbi:MFS transporter [Saccharopolyspora taberi]|uniref:MFS transporter n=1 Tax=Saccharopolyspora taberi TaxID=60895 RepID=A0ABN3V346_9PSEU